MLGKKESILESTEVNRRVLQYFIDLMGCSYQLDEFSDADLDADLNNLALKVFNSVSFDDFSFLEFLSTSSQSIANILIFRIANGRRN